MHSYLYVQVHMCCTGSISWKFNKIPHYKKKKAGNGSGPVCICVEGDLMSCHITHAVQQVSGHTQGTKQCHFGSDDGFLWVHVDITPLADSAPTMLPSPSSSLLLS